LYYLHFYKLQQNLYLAKDSHDIDTPLMNDLAIDLARLRALEDNWDDQGAVLIPEELIDIAQEVGRMLSQSTVEIAQQYRQTTASDSAVFISGATPVPDGSVDLWCFDDCKSSTSRKPMQCTLSTHSFFVCFYGVPEENETFFQESATPSEKAALVASVIKAEALKYNNIVLG